MADTPAMTSRLFHAVIASGIAFGASAVACSATETTATPAGVIDGTEADPARSSDEDPLRPPEATSLRPTRAQTHGTMHPTQGRMRRKNWMPARMLLASVDEAPRRDLEQWLPNTVNRV